MTQTVQRGLFVSLYPPSFQKEWKEARKHLIGRKLISSKNKQHSRYSSEHMVLQQPCKQNPFTDPSEAEHKREQHYVLINTTKTIIHFSIKSVLSSGYPRSYIHRIKIITMSLATNSLLIQTKCLDRQRCIQSAFKIHLYKRY